MLGWTALAIGLIVLVIVLAAFDSPRPMAGFASAFALQFLGSVLIGLAVATRIVHRRTPMLKRAAYVLDRRSQTNEQGGIGATLYIFKIRFEDGSEGEFSHIGRGSMYEPPANGAAGVAYTRGARMIEFRRI